MGLSNPSLFWNVAMKSKAVKLIVIGFLLCAITSSVMIATVDTTRYKNPFIRKFPLHAADFHGAVKFSAGRTSIAGFSNNSVDLQTGRNLTELSLDMLDTCPVHVDNPLGYKLIIDSPYFFIQSGTTSHLQKGTISNWIIDTTFAYVPFTAIQPINTSTAVLRIIDMTKRKNVFVKTNSRDTVDVLRTQVDGILCTDGFLQYSKEAATLVYTYRYRNEFLCLDTNLNVLRTGKTIDTISTARISVTEIGGKITMSKPPFNVNKGTCVSGELLFVNSNLVARNESPDEVGDRSVIDVYNIPRATYLYSFYIHDQANTKMQGFKVKGSILVAVFPNYIVRYDLARPVEIN